MEILAQVVTTAVALIHVYFFVLEMFLWTRPYGRRVFKTQEAFALETAPLAANQGLYNGFLAIGLLLGVVGGSDYAVLRTFCLLCVVVAGVYGSFTVSKRIFVIQSAPALLALGIWEINSSN